jgi:hypothetical protein
MDAETQKSDGNPWGDVPIKDMTQEEFEAKYRENRARDGQR